MYTPSEFRAALVDDGVDAVVEKYLLCEQAAKVTGEELRNIKRAVAWQFSVPENEVTLHVVGSAKLGFSLVEKRLKDGAVLPRYRPFGPDSDIDIAVICPKIFDQVWFEISAYSHRSAYWPWEAQRLGDYLVCGWLRPDHFPRPHPRKCQDWWDCFRRLSVSARRKVRGGLYYSQDHLVQYLRRAVEDCLRVEELGL